MAVVTVVATLTFGSSLADAGATIPISTGGTGPTPFSPFRTRSHAIPTAFETLVRADPDVATWTPVQFLTLELDGQAIPFMFEPPGASIAPRSCRGTP